MKYGVENISNNKIELDIIIAIRPFNPEGVSIVEKISYISDNKYFLINGSEKVYLSEQPDKIVLSNLKNGDTANLLLHQNSPFYADEIECENFWSLAGIKSFILICEILKEESAIEFAKILYRDYADTLKKLLTVKSNSANPNGFASAPN